MKRKTIFECPLLKGFIRKKIVRISSEMKLELKYIKEANVMLAKIIVLKENLKNLNTSLDFSIIRGGMNLSTETSSPKLQNTATTVTNEINKDNAPNVSEP